MNTHGHEYVGKNAGIEEIRNNFSSRNLKSPSLGSFLFGNWITDMSQLVDPVATKAVLEKIESLLQSSFFENFLITLGYNVDHNQMVDAKDKIRTVFKVLLEYGNNEKISLVNCITRLSLRISGYAKFVADPELGDDAISSEIYFKLFDQLLSQYYPHEHLDRPALSPVPFDNVPNNCPKPRLQDSYHSYEYDVNEERKHYQYLEDHIGILSGILTELDLYWVNGNEIGDKGRKRFKTFQTTDTEDFNKNFEWHLYLARLGHVLHGVEDYFAHSNFIEHVYNSMPALFNYSLSDVEKTVLFKRLRKFETSKPSNFKNVNFWYSLNDEENIVTGYFDATDTIASLLHLLEHQLGLDKFEDEKDLSYQEQFSSSVNSIIAKLLFSSYPSEHVEQKKYTPSYDDVKELLNDDPILKKVEPEVFDDLVSYILHMSKIIVIGKRIVRPITAYSELFTFLVDPIEWLFETLGLEVSEVLKNKYGEEIKRSLYRFLDFERIGSHTLISKDHGTELLYNEMRQCALVAHRLIVYYLISLDGKNLNWRALLNSIFVNPRSNKSSSLSLSGLSSFEIYETGANESIHTIVRKYSAQFKYTSAKKIIEANYIYDPQNLFTSEKLKFTNKHLIIPFTIQHKSDQQNLSNHNQNSWFFLVLENFRKGIDFRDSFSEIVDGEYINPKYWSSSQNAYNFYEKSMAFNKCLENRYNQYDVIELNPSEIKVKCQRIISEIVR